MSIVAVVGASLLGGSIAHRLSVQPNIREVRLIDSSTSVAKGLALDIQQAGAIENFDTTVTGKGHLHDVVGADIVVLAGPAGSPSLEWSKKEGLTVLEMVSKLNHHALTICSGSTHRSLVEHTVVNGWMARNQIIGSAPSALTTAIKAIVALDVGCSASNVSVAVLGKPPKQLVVPWSEVSVRGTTISNILKPQQLVYLHEKVDLIWPPGPYALSAAAADLCNSVANGTADRGIPCYVVLNGELGVRNSAIAVTVELKEAQVHRVVEPILSIRERNQLETALKYS